jgi:hypothetical protein
MRNSKAKNNSGKYKFPIDIKGDFELHDFDLSSNYENSKVKNKISSEIKEVITIKNKKKKCQSNKLI